MIIKVTLSINFIIEESKAERFQQLYKHMIDVFVGGWNRRILASYDLKTMLSVTQA